MEEEEKMVILDIKVETHLHLSIDTWSIPAEAFIGKDINESGLQIIKQKLEGQLVKVKSGEYENIAMGFIGKIMGIKSSGVRELEEIDTPKKKEYH
jgi:hypothetical protein